MIAIDMMSYRTSEHQGMQRFVQALNNKYQLPNRETLKTSLVPNYYSKLKNKLSMELSDCNFVSITTDMWTSASNEGILAVTCHYIQEGKLVSPLLRVMKIEGSHNAEAMAQIVGIVTDNAASMVNTASNLRLRHLPCFAHSLNLSVQDSFKVESFEKILSKCKAIATFFRSSTLASDTLRRIQKRSGKPELKLVQEVETRWNSSFFMLKRISMIRTELVIAMNECPRAPPTLTAENFEAIDEILKLLEPFELATTTVSGEHFITSSLIIPLTRGILMKLTSFENNLITDEGKDVLKSLTNSVKSRLKPYTTRTAAILATILDARFKKYGFLLSQDADHAMQLLQKEYASYLASKSKAAEPLILPEPSTHIASTSKIDELLFFSSDNQQVSTPVSDAIIDIRQYIEKPVIDRNDKYQNPQQTAENYGTLQKTSEESMENKKPESLEKVADSLKSMQNTRDSRKSYENAADQQPEQPPSDSTHDEGNVSQSSQLSFDGPRADSNDESMEKLINTLERSHSESSSSETDDPPELNIDEQGSDTDTPDTIKNSSTFEQKKKLGENSETSKFESAYKTLAMPSHVTARILNFRQNEASSGEESPSISNTHSPQNILQTSVDIHPQALSLLPQRNQQISPKSPVPKRKRTNEIPPQKLDEIQTVVDMDTDTNTGEFQTPKKFSTNFVKILRQKAVRSLNTKNRFEVLSESESENDEQHKDPPVKKGGDSKPQAPPKPKPPTTGANSTKTAKKSVMPPIVVEGTTDNHANLKKDLKNIITGPYTVKYTTNSTILFVEKQQDYSDLITSIREAKIPFHTYTSRAEKSHAFVLRGLTNGTEKEHIEEDLIQSYDIKPREIYQMSTKNRPLFLVVTDPAITLDFLNKNIMI
ncbi:unnamed protein product [Psylliodes chrysocephalus]|uniref:Uncharacterized protein n=1 Tax=Psylliodes chrysocephalus TaxID=3402493 RepID=A0A9P0GE38_9CUCU|nr:unnamed protein product [Psylliodes chrysocephala]